MDMCELYNFNKWPDAIPYYRLCIGQKYLNANMRGIPGFYELQKNETPLVFIAKKVQKHKKWSALPIGEKNVKSNE